MSADSKSKPALPAWFTENLAAERQSRIIDVDGCPIHYLYWPGPASPTNKSGILLVHGGGAHAHWWAFIAPFLLPEFRVAALDLSGMGDSGTRQEYDAAIRAREMLAVIEDAELGPEPFVVGHSYGGFMTMRFGADYGERIGGAVIVDSPIYEPSDEDPPERPVHAWGPRRLYPDRQSALARFRLMPEQSCDNTYLVDYIAEHSIRQMDGGWCWKFDPATMGRRRFGEPFHEYLEGVSCRAALLYGQESRLVSRSTARYMATLMGPRAPIVAIPGAQHHVMLDQPLGFVAALRTLLELWRLEGS